MPRLKNLIFSIFLILSGFQAAAQPGGFIDQLFSADFNRPVGMTFDDNGRMYVWEKSGRVYYVENGTKNLMLDIREEVGSWGDHGLLGFTLDPNFLNNGYFYLLYAVDRHHLLNFGTPAYDSKTNEYNDATIGRVTRYTANASDGFNTVDETSRLILLGDTPQNGIPILYSTHGVGSLLFGTDGTLLVSSGDGAYLSDRGGAGNPSYSVQGLMDGIIKPKEDVGTYRSQLVDCLNGKILRIDPVTGEGLPSNPFFDAANPKAPRSKVYALGLRQPFRMSKKPNTGSHNKADGNPGVIYLGEVGYNQWEELNIVTAPALNFGWPLFEGLTLSTVFGNDLIPNLDAPNPQFGINGCTQEFFTFKDLLLQETLNPLSFPNPCDNGLQIPSNVNGQPIYKFEHNRPAFDWFHGTGPARTGIFNGNDADVINIGEPGSPVSGPQFAGNASIGGVWYTGTVFPPQYQNTYFHGDLGEHWIKAFKFDSNDQPVSVENFLDDATSVIGIYESVSEGCLYYIDGTSNIRKVSYGANAIPVAEASLDTSYSTGNSLTVNFTGSTSYDPEGGPITYLWDFGDGSPMSSLPNPSHDFNTTDSGPVQYNVTLTVTDNQSNTGQSSLIVSLNNSPPSVLITSPLDSTLYAMDQGNITYNLTANVTDVQHTEAELTYAWQTILHHNDHYHEEEVDSNPITTSTISPIGCDGQTYYYRIVLVVTDAHGLSGADEVVLLPNCEIGSQSITFDSIPDYAVSAPPFKLSATASSGLPVQYSIVSGPASISEDTLTLLGVAGTVTVRASQPGNSSFQPASDVERSFQALTGVSQTITFPQIPDKTTSSPQFKLNATSSSGLPVSYLIVSGPAELNGDSVRLTGTAGMVVISASQAGNSGYAPAPDVENSFQVAVINNMPTPEAHWPFDGNPNDIINGHDGTLMNGATFDNNAVVGLQSLTLDGTDDFLHLVGDGSSGFMHDAFSSRTVAMWINPIVSAPKMILFDQGGYGRGFAMRIYNDQLQATIRNGKNKTQVVISTPFTADGDWHHAAMVFDNSQLYLYLDGQQMTAAPTSFSTTLVQSDGGAIGYRSGSGDAFKDGPPTYYSGWIDDAKVFEEALDANQIQLLAAGQTSKTNQTIAFDSIADKMISDNPFALNAVASSGLPVSFNIIAGPATLLGNTITLEGTPGLVTVRASQAGDDNYNPAPHVERSFQVVAPTPPTIQIINPTEGATLVGSTVALNYSISGDLTGVDHLHITLDNNPHITIHGPDGTDSITNVTPGPHSIQLQLVTSTHQPLSNPEAFDSVNFMVQLMDQTISFDSITDKLITDNPFVINASASSGLPVSYSIVSGPAIISNDTIKLDGFSGTVTVAADQAGNEHYNPAPTKFRSFEVLGPGDPTITITSPSENQILSNSVVVLNYTLGGDLTEVDRMEVILDTDPPIIIFNPDGTDSIQNVTVGNHSLSLQLQRSDGSPFSGAEAFASVNFSISDTQMPTPQAHWPFDGNPNDVINGHDGTLINGATFDNDAAVGPQSLTLDGTDDYLHLVGEASSGFMHDAFTSRTVTMWIKPIASAPKMILFDQGGYGRGFAMRIYNDQLQAAIRNGKDITQVVISTPFTADGAWHHAAMVFENSQLYLYLDGQQMAAAPTSFSTALVQSDGGAIGFRSGSGDAFKDGPPVYYSGWIDDAKVFDEALDANQIMTLVDLAPPSTSGPESFYSENSGETHENKIVAYPNPVKDRLLIQYTVTQEQEFRLIMVDMIGKTVDLGKHKVDQGSTIKTFHLKDYQISSGLYLLKITSEDLPQKLLKIIVQ